MANLCIKTPSSAIQVLIFQLLVLRPRPSVDEFDWTSTCTKRRKQAAGNELEIESQTFLLGYSVEEAIFLKLLIDVPG